MSRFIAVRVACLAEIQHLRLASSSGRRFF
jgi:hypothetical protein